MVDDDKVERALLALVRGDTIDAVARHSATIIREHIASLTSRALKAEGERDEIERTRELMAVDFGRLCATLGVDEDAPEAVAYSLNARFAIAKAEADRMRGALEEAERLYSTSGLLANDPACGAWINRTRDILKRAALSHQADDAVQKGGV